MNRIVLIGLIIIAACLSGCGKSKTDLEAELSASGQETLALKARVDALEGRVQAIEASLPDDEPPKQ